MVRWMRDPKLNTGALSSVLDSCPYEFIVHEKTSNNTMFHFIVVSSSSKSVSRYGSSPEELLQFGGYELVAFHDLYEFLIIL